MTLHASERSRLSAALYARGVALLGFTALAIRWPDETLFFALVGGGASLAVLGIFQLGMHAVSDELPSTKTFLLGDGVTTMTFGTLLIVMPLLGVHAALLCAAAWALAYCVSLVLLAGRLWFMPVARHALLGWATVTLLGAIAALWAGPVSAGSMLYMVAAYAWCYALVHLAAGVWLHRRHRVIRARSGRKLTSIA
jgi:hypothetical protein